MKKLILLLTLTLLGSNVFASESSNISADEALAKLKQGNTRFVKMKSIHPHEDKARRQEMVKGQQPYVVILSCSDSRVSPDIIFDSGLGDLFEVRNAGNVLNDHVIGSIEYAVYHLGVKLILIMGHTNCGAVAATLSDSKESPYIESLKSSIAPAVKEGSKTQEIKPDDISKIHAQLDIKSLKKHDKRLAKYIEQNNIKIIPALYHIDSGVVEFFE